MIANYGLSGIKQQSQRVSFGSYEVVDTLHSGSNRTHYLARHVISNENVMLTTIDASLQLPDRISRFVHDMSQVEMIRHSNIAPLHTVDVINNRPYVVVSFGAKGTLQQMLASAKTKPFKLKQALALMQQLAVAMQYAHDNGFLLGNLAPETIMFAQDGTPLLAEVGMVQALVNAGVPSNTTAVGRRGYLSPERAKGKTLSAAGDVYALGALLHELLLGRAPAQADGSGAQKISGSMLPQRVVEVINKALSDDPAERYETPFDFERAIAAIGRQTDHTRLLGALRRSAIGAAVLTAIGAGIVYGRAYVSAETLSNFGAQASTAITTARETATQLFNNTPQTMAPPVTSASYITIDISEDPVTPTAPPPTPQQPAVQPTAAFERTLSNPALPKPTSEAVPLEPTLEAAVVDDFLVNPSLQPTPAVEIAALPEPAAQPVVATPAPAVQPPARVRRVVRKPAPVAKDPALKNQHPLCRQTQAWTVCS